MVTSIVASPSRSLRAASAMAQVPISGNAMICTGVWKARSADRDRGCVRQCGGGVHYNRNRLGGYWKSPVCLKSARNGSMAIWDNIQKLHDVRSFRTDCRQGLQLS